MEPKKVTPVPEVPLPTLQKIRQAIRQLVDYRKRPIFGIDVIRWPGWGTQPKSRCYEIETRGCRPGMSERKAAEVIRGMLAGQSYHEAASIALKRKVTQKPRNRKGPKR